MGWKLVRDGQPEWCKEHNVSGKWSTADTPRAAIKFLAKKIGEEYGEYIEGFDLPELFDLLDVVNRLLDLHEEKFPDLYDKCLRDHTAKIEALGGFDNLTIWSPVP